jgi:hypothetical protein
MLSSHNTGRQQRYLSIALLALTLAACAPDAWRPDSPYDAFLDQIRIKCWDTRLGSTTIPELMPDALTTDAYFMDVTSRFYNGQISRENYIGALEGSYAARPDSTGIQCILAQMPQKTPLSAPPPL